jgi:6-phosphogluconolactonase (cycloisomerase 2 family)
MAIAFSASTYAAGATEFVFTNDDQSLFSPGISIYKVEPSGLLTFQQHVITGGAGIGGGFFGLNRISVSNNSNGGCIYVSQAGSGDIAGIALKTLAVASNTKGSATDAGTANGIGLAMNDDYLYASFTDSNTIGTFKVQSGCSLTFVNDTPVIGLEQGTINGMAVHGNVMAATYTDGSIESFDLSLGPPISRDDKQLSTATKNSQGATYPNSVDITKDGHYAIFGDTSTSVVVEVSDITSGKLTKTVVHRSEGSISSSNIMLSPDESVLYVANTQGATVTAMFFDKNTGKLSCGCTSSRIRGQSANWSYLAGMALINTFGNGGGVYVAEFGGDSGIAIVRITSADGKCSLRETIPSPVADPFSPGLLSIGSFPPRSF